MVTTPAMLSNCDRASAGLLALVQYATRYGYDDEPMQTVLVDLLTNLRHYAANTETAIVDFDSAVRVSADHFAEERPAAACSPPVAARAYTWPTTAGWYELVRSNGDLAMFERDEVGYWRSQDAPGNAWSTQAGLAGLGWLGISVYARDG